MRAKCVIYRLHCWAWFTFVAASHLSTPASAAPSRFAAGPDSNQTLLLETLASAKASLDVNVYSFTSHKIRDAILDRIRAGIAVRVLVEGEPVGQPPAIQLEVMNQFKAEMLRVRNPRSRLYWMSTGGDRTKRRFVYNHAKYIIVDGQTALVSSDNFTTTGHTDPGFVGSRGWDLALNDRTASTQLQALFNNDSDTRFGDVIDMLARNVILPPAPPRTQQPKVIHVAPRPRTGAAYPIGSGDATFLGLATSPNALPGIEKFLRMARSSAEIEHMSLPLSWYSSPGQPSYLNPIVAEIVQTARRGIQTRVLLNDESAFGGGGAFGLLLFLPDWMLPDGDAKQTNLDTVKYLNQLGQNERIPLTAKIVNTSATQINYIHNKSMVADRRFVFVSSVNGTQNSVEKNRELAIHVDSPAAGDYFTRVFNFDWERSGWARTR